MGIFKKAIRTTIALKALDVARREAAKPENQRKARELLHKLQTRGKRR